jgi:hypothetical protein
MAVLDWLQQLLGGGQYGDPSVPAMSPEPLEGTLRSGGALGQAGLPVDGAQGYTADVLQHLKDVISGKVAYEGVLGPGYQGDNRALDIAGGLVGAIKPAVPRVVRTLDTANPPLNPNDWNSGFLRGVGWWEPERSVISGTHVTDDPSILQKVLQAGGPITNRGPDKYGDLGPGLYFSDSPQIWGSRSRSKWDFLDELTKGQRENLAGTLAIQIEQMPKGYVTSSERDAALNSINYFRTGQAPPQVLLNVADQPYNIDLANPEFLKRLGIAPGRQPVEAPIEVAGRFAQLDRNVYGNEADLLRDRGYQGAFTQGGFSTTPQFVVWDRDAVKSFNRILLGLR